MAEQWRALNNIRRDFARTIHQRDAATPGYLCPRCHLPIDWTLRWPHLESRSVDHIVELQDGGAMLDPNNATTVHLKCNAAKGSRRWHQRRREATQQRPTVHEDPYRL